MRSISCRYTFAAIIFGLTCLLSKSALAQSPSFNCRRATSAVEHAICNNSQLASLDVQLSALFKSATLDLREDQKAWLSWRDSCPSKPAGDDSMNLTDCVKGLYQLRIAELQYINGLGTGSEADASAALQLLSQTVKCPIALNRNRFEETAQRLSFTGDAQHFAIRDEVNSVWVGHSATSQTDDPTVKQDRVDNVSARFSELYFAVPTAGSWLLVVCKKEQRCINHSAGPAEWYYVLVLCDWGSQRDATDAFNTMIAISRR